jgi:hypothetical protein
MGVKQVVALFVCTSLLMWALPLWLLYAFNNNKLVPGSQELSSSSLTLWSGLLAVLSLNLVIVGYILLALREKSSVHSPDPAFLSRAKASISDNKQDPSRGASSSPRTSENSSGKISN